MIIAREAFEACALHCLTVDTKGLAFQKRRTYPQGLETLLRLLRLNITRNHTEKSVYNELMNTLSYPSKSPNTLKHQIRLKILYHPIQDHFKSFSITK
jgi:hypothetical protein